MKNVKEATVCTESSLGRLVMYFPPQCDSTLKANQIVEAPPQITLGTSICAISKQFFHVTTAAQ